jgi:hypothetical protein
MRNLLPISLAILLFIGLLSFPATAQPATKQAPADRAQLEEAFAARLSNSRLVGSYVIEGRKGPPQQDQYTLGKVTKSQGDKWVFNARIEYAKKSINVPLAIPVLWAGDTPVITVTHFGIPGLGTYTARVMIVGDHYAGTWSSGPEHGGYLWGVIEHGPAADSEKPEKAEGK